MQLSHWLTKGQYSVPFAFPFPSHKSRPILCAIPVWLSPCAALLSALLPFSLRYHSCVPFPWTARVFLPHDRYLGHRVRVIKISLSVVLVLFWIGMKRPLYMSSYDTPSHDSSSVWFYSYTGEVQSIGEMLSQLDTLQRQSPVTSST